MGDTTLTGHEARQRLYEIVRRDVPFEEKAHDALELGKQYLGADNGYLTRIDQETDHWEAIVSTDETNGPVPAGLELDLGTTYCRRTLAEKAPIALHDVPNQGWADDPAFETYGLHCYHGTTLIVDGESFGTVCFAAEDPRTEQFSDGETMFAELITRMLERELEREQHEADLMRQTNLATVLNRVLRHNLRNDMSVIRGFTQLMADKLEGDLIGNIALSNIDKLIALSEKARVLDRFVAADFEREPTEIVALVEELIESVEADYPEASIALDYDEEITAAVFPSFARALEELIENAAKHGGDTPRITVSIESIPNAVEIRITDDGPGLADHEADVLKTGTETPLTHGTGLGLWLAHWIVTSHDGSITATAAEDGTSLTISIPRKQTGESTGVQKQLTQLTRARDQYQAVFEETSDAIVIVNNEARILDANPEAAPFFRVDRQKLLGQALSDVLPEEFDLEAVWQELQTAGETRGSVTFAGTDGADRSIEYSAQADIIPGQHLIISRDITERKERERELTRNKRAMDEAPVGITLTDPEQDDNPLIYANNRFEKLTGYTKDEILGRNCRLLQGEATNPESVARIREAIEQQERVSVELRNYRKDGTEFWNEVSIAPVRDDDGSLANYVGFQQNVSDQRRRERVLRDMYDIISDRHQSFEEQVQALLDLGRTELNTEYGTLSEIRGDEYVFKVVVTDDDSIQSGDIVPVAATNCELVASTEKTLVLGDIERDAPEQTDRAGFTEWGISCYLGAPVFLGDDVYGTFCFYDTEARSDQFSEWEVTLVDLMSRWASYELQRRQANEQLQQTNDQLEQFSSVVSHDLRNPLSVAKGRLALADEECDSEHLEPIGGALDRMDGLISDLLVLARGDNSTTEITSVQLATLSKNCWRNVDTANATLVTDVDRTIRADESRLRQLFENLIRNAVEHGGDHVTVTVGELDHGFYIEDDGPGIPADERDDVFDVGYSTQEEGTGFGLRIVEQIVDAHGWAIHVTEGTEGGARFEITGIEFGVE